MKRVLAALACVLLSACSLLVGIDEDLGVKTRDAGNDAEDTGATPPPPPFDIFDAAVDYDAAAYPTPQRPPEGTYTYAAAGSDRLQGPLIDNQASYGPTATVKVVHIGGDCWEQTFTLRQDYTETMRLCVRGLFIAMEHGERSQKFAIGASASTTQDCKPGDIYASTGPTLGPWPHDCTGHNADDKTGQSTFEVRGTYSYQGDETVMVGSEAVATHHFLDNRTVSGSQNGSNVTEWWLSASDASIVKMTRKIDISYSSTIGKITYTERVTKFDLLTRPAASDAGSD